MTMDKFIAFYGRDCRDVVWAASEAAALEKAKSFAIADGMSPEEAADDEEVYVRKADFWVLKEYGLLWLDDRENGYVEAEARP